MADHGTRKTTTDRLEEAISCLSVNHTSLADKHTDLADKVDSILDRLNHLTLHTSLSVSSATLVQCTPVKLDVPRFNGRDVMGRIFKISQLFEYQGCRRRNVLWLCRSTWTDLPWTGTSGCSVMDSSLPSQGSCKHLNPIFHHHSMMTPRVPSSSCLSTVRSMTT